MFTINRPTMRLCWIIGCLAGWVLASGCAATQPIVSTQIVRVLVTATTNPDITPDRTPLPSATPTVTPSPTPTAPPAIVTGDPLAQALRQPQPVGGAPCGLVDILDFPLDAPDGEAARGGWDFGAYRSRYGKYHAGEDWGLGSRSNLGAPVFSIGHGQVTYAQPKGWGVDQGVVIVRHVFQDGRRLLSFYGHLDPDSVVLQPGRCVSRGDQVGAIGRPRGFPHLHFEVRLHLPDTPGPGYWPTDPVRAGWLPPSQTIWESRLEAQENVIWIRSAAAGGRQVLGIENGDTLLALEEGQLMGIGLEDGEQLWVLELDDEEWAADVAALALNRPWIYLADQAGQVVAQPLPPPSPGASDQLPWTSDLDAVGRPVLLPLPDGGVAVHIGRKMYGLSPEGGRLWSKQDLTPPMDVVTFEDRLLFTTLGERGGVWEITPAGPVMQVGGLSGRLAVDAEVPYLYTGEGVYRLDPQRWTVEQILALPSGNPQLGDLAARPGGGLLVAHRDRADERLIALDGRGALLWDRSLRGVAQGQPALSVVEDEVFLVSQGRAGDLGVFAVDTRRGNLVWVLEGGTRAPRPGETGVWPNGSGILLQIGGGGLVSLRVGG